MYVHLHKVIVATLNIIEDLPNRAIWHLVVFEAVFNYFIMNSLT
jgi:hypothetical protein